MTFLKFTFRLMDQCMSLKNGINNVQFPLLVQFSSVLMAFSSPLGGRLEVQSKFHDILYLPFDNLYSFMLAGCTAFTYLDPGDEGCGVLGYIESGGLACLRNYKKRGGTQVLGCRATKQVVQVVGASACLHSFVILLLRQFRFLIPLRKMNIDSRNRELGIQRGESYSDTNPRGTTFDSSYRDRRPQK